MMPNLLIEWICFILSIIFIVSIIIGWYKSINNFIDYLLFGCLIVFSITFWVFGVSSIFFGNSNIGIMFSALVTSAVYFIIKTLERKNFSIKLNKLLKVASSLYPVLFVFLTLLASVQDLYFDSKGNYDYQLILIIIGIHLIGIELVDRLFEAYENFKSVDSDQEKKE